MILNVFFLSSFTHPSSHCLLQEISFFLRLGDKKTNFCSITRGASPSKMDKTPTIIIYLCCASSLDFLFNLLANGCQSTYPVKIPSNVAIKAALIACPNAVVSLIFPRAATNPITAPKPLVLEHRFLLE